MRVLVLLSLSLFVTATLIASLRSSRPIGIENLIHLRWFWVYMLFFFLPIGIGIYYWYMLRDEEIIVTDEYIARRSLWGDEKIHWHKVVAYRKQILPFRETRLGHIAGLSRWLTGNRLFRRIPPYAYELVAQDSQEQLLTLRLEPGTINDMPWLLQLVTEHVGEPEIV